MSRKQQLLKRHRRTKRLALLISLVLLVAVGLLVTWWLPLVLAVLAWVAHEAWFADHLFYSPRDDYDYQIKADEQRLLCLSGDRLSWPDAMVLDESDTLVLKIRIKSTWLGRFFDPGVQILGGIADRQDFERGARGVRYLNLTGQQTALRGEGLTLKGSFCALDPQVELFVLRHPDYRAQRVLVIAPHADDAELAAFGLYSQATQSWIVTLTAGEIEAEHYQQMGLDPIEASRLKGALRAWDSISVPLWAGVPQERCVQLGYFCLQLAAMQAAPEQPVGSREADMADTRMFRRFNAVTLASDVDGIPSWQNLIQDLVELIEQIRPEVIVLPHPSFDPHPDHLCAQQAVMQALCMTSSQPAFLLHYANHLHDNDRWPMGAAGCGVALPPQLTAEAPLRPWVLPVSSQDQWHKAMSLGMMHDLQPPPPFKRKIRRLIQRWLAGRRWPASGENEFFRKAVRQHELFWVDEIPGKREGI
ncbi:PIG-L deacetylase family protein [Pseudomonas gingeri]|uniref:PIG-L deacetylase family protein n=1 Tax=Pseudomonas gingeri TaxID=117681 RepID=UPI0015BD2350|nr:PIG-L family deacetylase [Pseudomonas gingeri]NWD47511.1 PIG-L family deacetylase [Pseudomonas gingeri]